MGYHANIRGNVVNHRNPNICFFLWAQMHVHMCILVRIAFQIHTTNIIKYYGNRLPNTKSH